MPKDLLIALGGGIVTAALFLSPLYLGQAAAPFIFLAPLPAMLVGLALGFAPAAVAGAAALVIAGLVGGVWGATNLAVASVLPVLLLVQRALLSRPAADGGAEWYPPGLLAAWLTGFGGVLHVVVVLWLSAGQAGARETVRAHVAQMLKAAGFAELLTREDGAALTDALAAVLPGTAIAGWLLSLIILGVFAQGLLVLMGRNRRPSPEFAMLELPRWMAPAAGAAALGAVAAPGAIGYFAQNLLIILALPFFLTGLAVAHVVSRRWSARPMVLLALYFLLLVIRGPIGLLLTALGVVEQWARFRRRFSRPGHT